jgi:hypothetical protein
LCEKGKPSSSKGRLPFLLCLLKGDYYGIDFC